MLKGKHIILGITGGISAYKIPFLVRELRKSGAEVRIVMTDSAKEFVTPLTLSTLSGEEVRTEAFPQKSSEVVRTGTWHIALGEWANLMVIAPATANVIAKLAQGFADDTVSMLALAVRCPLVISPAMDVDMWKHPATQSNVSKLKEMGVAVLPPEEGELASGLTGPGRLPDLGIITAALEEILSKTHQDLKGKKILITAGPTREAIDPVRFIGNRSSGKMGFAIAGAAAQRGAETTLISGPVHLATPRNVKRIDVESGADMYAAVKKHRGLMDAIIMAAAVSDYAPVSVSSRKIKKGEDEFALRLRPTTDILRQLGETKGKTLLVGFALETGRGIPNARKKLKEKNLDFIVLNNPLRDGAGFGADTNIVTILSRNGREERLRKMSKFDVAEEILDRISRKLPATPPLARRRPR